MFLSSITPPFTVRSSPIDRSAPNVVLPLASKNTDLDAGIVRFSNRNRAVNGVLKFQNVKEGEFVIICDVGAYGMSLSSNYNLRPNPAEVIVKNSKFQIIKKRQRITDINYFLS